MYDELEHQFVIAPKSEAELSPYVLSFSGKASMWDDEAGDDIEVASMSGHRIDLASLKTDGKNVEELFESLYPDILEFEETTFSDNTCWLSEPDPKGNPMECSCLVYIDEIVVDSAHRNQGIGTKMMERMSQLIELENCLVGLKAYPISKDIGRTRTLEEIENLRAFYQKLGFTHAGKHFFEKDGNECAIPKKRHGKT